MHRNEVPYLQAPRVWARKTKEKTKFSTPGGRAGGRAAVVKYYCKQQREYSMTVTVTVTAA